MKSILRIFILLLVSVLFSDYFLGSFTFGGNFIKNLFMVVLALAMLFFLLRPVMRILSLPLGGPGFLLISSISVILVLYLLTTFLRGFGISPIVLSDLNILGFMLPSWRLDSLASLALSGFIVNITYQFMEWLCSKK